MWSEKNAPWMQALTCFFGAGSMLAPLIAKPFLSTKDSNPVPLNGTTPKYQSTQLRKVSEGKEVIPTRITSNISSLEGNGSKAFSHDVIFNALSPVDNNASPPSSESILYQAYIIVASLFFASSFFVITLGLMNRYIWGFKSCRTRSKSNGITKIKSLTPTFYIRLLMGSLFSFTFSYMLIEHATFMFLFTFAVKVTRWTKNSAVLLVFLYMLGYTLTRGICAFLAHCIKPIYTLFTFTILTMLSSVILWIWHEDHGAVLWTCGIGIGIGIAPIYAAAITLFNTYHPITPFVGGLAQFASATSGVVVPSALGFFYKLFGPVLLVYIIFFASVLVLLCIISMLVLGRLIGRYKENHHCTEQLT